MAGARFAGRVVLVTGAASGIGRAAALRLAAEGATLVLADQNLTGAEAVARTASESFGASAAALRYDAADAGSCRAMVDAAVAVRGRLDVLIANAGIYRRGHFAEMAASDWKLVMAVNLDSLFHVIQQALPALIAARGNVVCTSSIAALGGIAYAAPYAAAKAGVIALTKSLAAEYAPVGVRFNAVCPGRVRSAIGAGLAPVVGQNPDVLVRPPKLLGKVETGEPEDVAGAFAYLASEDAAFVSGSVLVIDGAQTVG